MNPEAKLALLDAQEAIENLKADLDRLTKPGSLGQFLSDMTKASKHAHEIGDHYARARQAFLDSPLGSE